MHIIKGFERMITVLLMASWMLLVHGGEKEEDNIHIISLDETYRYKSDRKGGISSIKITEKTTYCARHRDSQAIAYTSYNNDFLKVDKASAPGAKPSYSQAIGKDVFYDDHRLCIMSVPVKKGKPATAEFVCTHTDAAQICVISFSRLYDIDNYNLTIELPPDLTERLRFSPVNFPDDAEVSVSTAKDGTVTYTYQLKGLKRVHDEPFSPPYLSYKPHILVTGFFKDVDDVYAYLKSYIGDEPVSPEVAELASRLTADCVSDLEKIDNVAAWVRNNIRYVAIEHGEYGRRPESAAKVLAQRYGDCKGSANLIKGLLRSSGLDARLVWIGTKDKCPYRWQDFPTLASGNHMIAACLLPDSVVFIDGTITGAPAGCIPLQLQGQSAIIEDGDSFFLADVPAGGGQPDAMSAFAEYTLAGNRLYGKYKAEFSGDVTRQFDSNFRSTTPSQREAWMHGFVSGANKSMKLDNVVYTRPAENSIDASLTADVTISDALKVAGGKNFLKLTINGYQALGTADTDKRENSLYLSFPVNRVGHTVIDIGDKTEGLVLPDDVHIRDGLLSCDVTYKTEGSKVLVDSSLNASPGTIPVENLKQWNETVRQINKALSPVIKFN